MHETIWSSLGLGESVKMGSVSEAIDFYFFQQELCLHQISQLLQLWRF